MTKSLEALIASVREKMKRPDELGGVMIGYFTLDALIAALEEKDKRTTACVNAFDGIETERIAGKSLGEFLAGELYLNKAEPKKDGSFGSTFSGFAIQMMAECFANQFKSSGAINYLELLFEHVDIGEMTVTMQRVEGLTPAGKLAAAECRIAELESGKLSIPAGWKIAPTTATRSMVKVGGAAARKYMEETGGNSPYVIYEAMVSVAPVPELEALCVKSADAMREVAPLCVKLPGERFDDDGSITSDFDRGWDLYREEAIAAVLSAGGTVEGSE